MAIIAIIGHTQSEIHNDTCEPKPHRHWVSYDGAFYTMFAESPCRFPDCQEACRNNNAELVFPNSISELTRLLSFTNIFRGDAYLGLHLPMFRPERTYCSRQKCNKFLRFVNDSDFTYLPWMKDMFSRRSKQERCFKIKVNRNPQQRTINITHHVVPTECDDFLMAICKTTQCPSPTYPIAPYTLLMMLKY